MRRASEENLALTGSAPVAPVRPVSAPVSHLTHTAIARSGVKQTGQKSRFLLVVPVLPDTGKPNFMDVGPLAVARATTPSRA